MMNWLRSRLRAWLGIDDCATYAHMNANMAAKQTQIDSLRSELDAFKSALKAKAAQVPSRPVYTDYESSQQAVLAEFEKEN